MTTRKTMRAGVLVLTLAAASAVSVAGIAVGSAGADVVSAPWQQSKPDPDRTGTLTFYDTTGKQVYGGNTDESFGFVVGSSDIPAGSTKASLYAYRPTSGAPVGAWSGSQLTAAAVYPGAVGDIPAGKVSLRGRDTDQSIGAFTVAYPSNDSPAGYDGVYELRLRATRPDGAVTGYDVADIRVNGSTWSLVYPSVTIPTTTTVTASPTSAVAGSKVTLSATVTPSEAKGTVQFRDGTTALGAPVAVTNGAASGPVTVPFAGSRSLTATFSAAAGERYGTSSGSATVAVTKATSTVIGVLSTSRPVYGRAWTVRSTVRATGLVPAGTVTLRYGSRVIAGAVLRSGAATLVVAGTRLVPGRRPLTLLYSGSANVAGSTRALAVTVVRATSRTTNVVSPKSVKKTKRAALTVRVSATGVVPTGSVLVFDGKKRIATAVLRAGNRGVVKVTLPKLKVGRHSVHSTYVGSTTTTGSTARSVVLTVKK